MKSSSTAFKSTTRSTVSTAGKGKKPAMKESDRLFEEAKGMEKQLELLKEMMKLEKDRKQG